MVVRAQDAARMQGMPRSHHGAGDPMPRNAETTKQAKRGTTMRAATDSRAATRAASAVRSGQERAKRIDSSNGDPVLVIGSGLHYAAGGPGLNWPALLPLVFPNDPSQPGDAHVVALAWEARLVDQAANRKRQKPSAAEKVALTRLACLLDGRYAALAPQPIYQRLRSGGIADLVTFNFDRGLHTNLDKSAWTETRRGPDLGGTRVWHPHGHTGLPDSIVFGTRRYGMEIRALEAAREFYWRAMPKADSTSLVDPTPTHWLHTFLSHRDLHLIGLGLRPEEWTIWWALTQRARRFARAPSVPKTVAYIYEDPNKPDDHDTWRTSALAALGIEQRRFGPGMNTAIWDEVLKASQRVEEEGNQ